MLFSYSTSDELPSLSVYPDTTAYRVMHLLTDGCISAYYAFQRLQEHMKSGLIRFPFRILLHKFMCELACTLNFCTL